MENHFLKVRKDLEQCANTNVGAELVYFYLNNYSDDEVIIKINQVFNL